MVEAELNPLDLRVTVADMTHCMQAATPFYILLTSRGGSVNPSFYAASAARSYAAPQPRPPRCVMDAFHE